MYKEMDNVIKELNNKFNMSIKLTDDKLRLKISNEYRFHFKTLFPDATEGDIDDMMIGCSVAIDMAINITKALKERDIEVTDVKVKKIENSSLYGEFGGSDE